MTTGSEAAQIVGDLTTFFQPPAMNEDRAVRYAQQIVRDMPETGAAFAAAETLIRHCRRWPSYADLLETYREASGRANSRNNMSPAVADEPIGECVPVEQVRSMLARVRDRFGRQGLDAAPTPVVWSSRR